MRRPGRSLGGSGTQSQPSLRLLGRDECAAEPADSPDQSEFHLPQVWETSPARTVDCLPQPGRERELPPWLGQNRQGKAAVSECIQCGEIHVRRWSAEGYSASDIRFLVDEAARDALKTVQDITNESFHSAMVRVQPSVTSEIEAQYRSIEQRGL